MIPAILSLVLLGCSGHPSGPVTSSADHLKGKPTNTSCDELDPAAQTRAHDLLSTLYAHDCCDATLLQCLQHEKRCLVAVRLAETVAARISVVMLQGADVIPINIIG